MEKILEMKSIRKGFAGVQALKEVNFDLYKGEVHALVGENGAGKSTLIKILSGFYTKDSGSIYLNGHEVDIRTPLDSQEMGIAVIYQDFDLALNLSVADNLLLGRESTRFLNFIHWSDYYRRAKEILKTTNLNVDLNTMVRDLSTAERQLLAIAKAISVNAKVIVMDEPTSALSTEEVDALFDVIKDLNKKSVSIIYISHHLDEIFKISHRVSVLRDGRYIGTKRTTETTQEEIVSMMVGRKMEDYYYKKPAVQNEILLDVKNFRRKGSQKALNFHVKRGEILGISGLVGAGRTELARSIFGLEPRESGEVYLEGKLLEISTPEKAIKSGIGFIPEDRSQGLVMVMNVLENTSIVALGNFSSKGFLKKKEEKEETSRFVKRFNIRTPSLQQKVVYLSGGNQQKVILAKWMMNKPKLLILDEPTAGVDVGAKAEIYRLMNDLAGSGVGIILISSELPEILGMSDRVLVMHMDRFVAEFSQDEATEEKIMMSIHQYQRDKLKEQESTTL